MNETSTTILTQEERKFAKQWENEDYIPGAPSIRKLLSKYITALEHVEAERDALHEENARLVRELVQANEMLLRLDNNKD